MSFDALVKKFEVDPDKYDTEAVLAMGKFPVLTVYGHVITKSIQVGAALGLVVGLLRKSSTALRGTRGGVIASAFAGAALTTARLQQEDWDLDRIEDRAYRISMNASQRRWDQLSLYGAAAGGVIGILAPVKAIEGLGVGVILGTAAWAAETWGQVELAWPPAPVAQDVDERPPLTPRAAPVAEAGTVEAAEVAATDADSAERS